MAAQNPIRLYKMALGALREAIFMGVKKRPQHRKLLRSIFDLFWKGFGSPGEGQNVRPAEAGMKFWLFRLS